MKLHLSFLAVRERESGRILFLAEVAHLSGGGDCAVVSHVHEIIRGPSEDGAAMRAKYSHALYVIDNQERAAYAFPDPADEERKRIERELAQAEAAAKDAARTVETAKKAADAARAAVKSVDVVADRVKTLRAELRKLNGPDAAEKAAAEKAAAEKAAAEKAAAEKAAAEKAAAEKAAAEKAAAEKAAAEKAAAEKAAAEKAAAEKAAAEKAAAEKAAAEKAKKGGGEVS